MYSRMLVRYLVLEIIRRVEHYLPLFQAVFGLDVVFLQ